MWCFGYKANLDLLVLFATVAKLGCVLCVEKALEVEGVAGGTTGLGLCHGVTGLILKSCGMIICGLKG